jgi:RNA polymerase sigma-70 factor (ECF subfamily)
MDERELVERAKTDKEAFGELYEQHVERIYKYVQYRVSNNADAEDLTARVFVRALQNIQNFEYRGVPFSAWLYRIAHNLVANWYRDNSRRQIFSLEDMGRWRLNSDGPEIAAESHEDQERLLQAIHRLPADRQEVLLLKFVEQLTNAEIGEVMGRSEGAIKSLYHRTLLALRKEMAHTDYPPQRRFSFWRWGKE